MTFATALSYTLGFEGGVSNDAVDRGGLTKWGVTQRSYDRYRTRMAQATQPVTEMTQEEMGSIYREDYWNEIRGDELPDPLADLMFDMAVNSGPDDAIKALQRALGVVVDGALGPKTLAAVHAAGSALPLEFLKQRGAHYRDIIVADPSQVHFLAGWINRLLEQAWRLP